MPQFYSPTTWQMGAAQLISPTTSQLAAINAIQAAITASSNWTVSATGTTTTGYKYVEAAPVGSTLYSEYRILFVERINSSSGKIVADGQGAFNSASFILMRFVPDGGRAGVTFTPANIETGTESYVGTNYKDGSSQVWHAFPSPWTATWLYTCDGAMWLIDRSGPTSHNVAAFGHVFVPSGNCEERNGSNVECGVPCYFSRLAIGSGTLAGTAPSQPNALINNSQSASAGFWRWTGVATRSIVKSGGTGSSTTANGSAAQSIGIGDAGQWLYYSASGGAIFLPFVWTPFELATNFGPWIMRGVYLTQNMKTRTTIQTGTPATTIGFTWYPDDAAQATNLRPIAFMNTP